MLCPKDNVVCDPLLLQDVEIDVCPKCQGVWLEQSEVRRLTRHFTIPGYSDVDEQLAKWEQAEHEGTAPRDFWVEDKLLCPKDGSKMKKHYFAGTLIGLDQCQLCKGFWMDGGELQAIAAELKPIPVIEEAIAFLAAESQKAMAKQRRKQKLYFNLWLDAILLAANPGKALHTKVALYVVWSTFTRYMKDMIQSFESVTRDRQS